MSQNIAATKSSMTPEQLHRISSIAKLSAGMIARTLEDIDGPREYAEEALAWTANAEEAAWSSMACCEALATLNAYLNHYGLDAKPIERDGGYAIGQDNIALTASSPLKAVDAEAWHDSVQAWCSSAYSQTERATIGAQLVNIVDQQVQTCYEHLRQQTRGIAMEASTPQHGAQGPARGEYRLADDTNDAIVLDDMPGMDGPK